MNLPQDFIDENHIEYLFISNRILVGICKGVYGLPQEGQIAYILLIKHLKLHSYTRAGFTPGLFKCATLDTSLCFVVGDFEVKYTANNDALHLINTLEKNTPASLFIGVVEFSLTLT